MHHSRCRIVCCCWVNDVTPKLRNHAGAACASWTFSILRRNCSIGSDFAYSYTFLRSVVCLSSVACHIHAPCLNRLADLHAVYQVRLWGSMTHCVRRGVPDTPRKRKIWRSNPSQNMQWQIVCCHLTNRNEKRFRVLPNYFGACLKTRSP